MAAPSNASRAARAAGLALLAAALAACSTAPTPPAAAPASPPLRVTTEAAWIDLTGLHQRLEQEKGRVVVLNFWATWCIPCREEFPALIELQRRHAGTLMVLAVSLDSPGDRDTAVKDFLAEQHPPFPVFLKTAGDPDPFISAIDKDWTGALPATFLYDRSGRRRQALLEPVTLESLESAVRPLL